MKFRYLNESWQMLDADSVELKRKYVDQVWDIIQIAYKKIGGPKGTGFRSKEDMIENSSVEAEYQKRRGFIRGNV